jgi:hypothetical protein
MGIALPPHWIDVSADLDAKDLLSEELRKECSPEHVLASRAFVGVAACGGCDSALFELDGGEWAVVHLTYAGRPEGDPRWPDVEAVGSWEDVLPVMEVHSSGEH